MALTVSTFIDETEIGQAIRSGDLQLALILQEALPDEEATSRLIREIEHVGGSHAAGLLAERFARAMQET
ncbi:hypothetical protein [Roseivivax isoporae]|uniref:Uncharacterized protein n=1 Tax=Roseivivax isoporae LMG 25204 TaxID=1449351 RepID=X7F1H7_9RHOB|nr:hypothetical protein [Roseivivax isoporae]ETX26620.1 hypothetical protein RISW2_21740 [Roseivivax isoporae LMG 25204]